MKNTEIYGKTLPFSLLRLLLSAIGLIVWIGLTLGTFLLTRNNESVCVTATIIACIVGVVIMAVLSHYCGYLLKAGQIAMITQGVTTGELPDDVVAAGKEAVKTRFVTVNVYYAIQSAINGITHQLTNGLNAATDALGNVGGNAGSVLGGIGSLVSAFISIMLEYVNYCCLGWVFKNPEQNAFKSTCDGAVIYFQNWKVLLKNAGKVFGIELLSIIVIGLPLILLCYALISASPSLLALLTTITEAFETTADVGAMVLAAALGLVVWGILNAAFIKPYVLVSVLRKYMEAGEQTPPKVDIYGKLCGLSAKFRKAWEKSGETESPAEPA